MENPSPVIAPTQAQIDRINEISQLARTAWFSLIAYLLFVGITLIGVEDADFFVPTRQTQLPLVNVQIPTASFFYAAPILGAALYTYLHLFLIKLWEAHGEACTRDADPTHHWLVNDYALIRQGDPVARARPLSWVVPWITLLLVWLAGPIVLGYAWWRSMPAHDEWMTLLIAACFFTTLAVGFVSWATARARLHHNNAPPIGRWRRLAATACALALVAVSWLRTEGGLDSYLGAFPTTDLLAPSDLSGAALGREPADWRERDYARGRYREVWCERHEVPLSTCEHIGTTSDLDSGDADMARAAWCKQGGISDETCLAEFTKLKASFDAEWNRERAAYLAQLDAPDQVGRDLRRANLWETFLVDANLRAARLDSAFLLGARLEEANLMGARLEGANLGGVRLDGANLEGARLEGANLQVARLDGANLSGADFRRSNWLGALKRPALAWGADFRGAQELTQAQLDNVIGDDGTLLPEGNAPDTGEPFHVWNCWETPAPELDQIIAAVGGRSADPAVLRVALLCRPDNPRRKAGTPLALDAPYPEGHPLADRY